MSIRLGNTILAGAGSVTYIDQPVTGSVLVVTNSLIRATGGSFYANVSTTNQTVTSAEDFSDTSVWELLTYDIDDALSDDSVNAVENQVVTQEFEAVRAQIEGHTLYLDGQETPIAVTFPAGGLVFENQVGGNLVSTVRVNNPTTVDGLLTEGTEYKWKWTDSQGRAHSITSAYRGLINVGVENVTAWSGLSINNARTSINENRERLTLNSIDHPLINEIRQDNGVLTYNVDSDGQLQTTIDLDEIVDANPNGDPGNNEITSISIQGTTYDIVGSDGEAIKQLGATGQRVDQGENSSCNKRNL